MSPLPEPPAANGDGTDPWVIDLEVDAGADRDDTRATARAEASLTAPARAEASLTAPARAEASLTAPARSGGPAPASPRSPASTPSTRARLVAAGLAIVLVGAIVGIWRADPEPPPSAVLGTRLAAPIALTRPVGAITTADGSYVGLQFPAGGVVLVTVPTEVVDPSGARRPLPADPAAWLARHPAVFVSRVRPVRLGGVEATQLDYRRSRMNAPPSRFARLSLFCGWRPETATTGTTGTTATTATTATRGTAPTGTAAACTQITADARVRATFVSVAGQTVLVEAVWRVELNGNGRMPRELQRSYASLLSGAQLDLAARRRPVARGLSRPPAGQDLRS